MLKIESINSINSGVTQQVKTVEKPNNASVPSQIATATQSVSNPIYASYAQPSFGAAQIRTALTSNEEKEQYNTVVSMLDKKSKQNIHELLKTGKLLTSNANDNTSTLDNLYKIATTERVVGLNKEKILSEVVNKIHYPYVITQKFGDVPSKLAPSILNSENMLSKPPMTQKDLVVHSSTCPAASIEFNLAHKMPAEFARMAEGLTSPNISVTKKINVSELSQNPVDVIWMLNEFEIPHKLENWNDLTVQLKPDRNAILRARVQNTYQDKGERSPLDVLMQSTFMNVGAQNTYNTLNDKRIPKYNEDDGGLTDIEKNFAEEMATGKGKICVTYQKIEYTNDPNSVNGKLVGYECKPDETLQHISDTLKGGDNVIIGYIYTDKDNNVVGGHEITITGIEKGKDGKQYFVCNDTDDGVDASIKYEVNGFLPKIHHAGIPIKVLQGKVEFVEGWKELMQYYKESKTNAQNNMA